MFFSRPYLESLWFKGRRSRSKIDVTDIAPGFVDTAMTIGKTFWMASTEKAAKQIYNAIERKKKKAYIIPIVIIKQSKLFYNFTMVNADRNKQSPMRYNRYWTILFVQAVLPKDGGWLLNY